MHVSTLRPSPPVLWYSLTEREVAARLFFHYLHIEDIPGRSVSLRLGHAQGSTSTHRQRRDGLIPGSEYERELRRSVLAIPWLLSSMRSVDFSGFPEYFHCGGGLVSLMFATLFDDSLYPQQLKKYDPTRVHCSPAPRISIRITLICSLMNLPCMMSPPTAGLVSKALGGVVSVS